VLAIRHYRQQRGLSQNKLAHLVGTTQATVSLIEQGFLHPDDKLLDDLAKVLDVSPSFVLLLSLEDEQPAEQTA
jgi:transcriptional regulator with XRE-family HTH domain